MRIRWVIAVGFAASGLVACDVSGTSLATSTPSSTTSAAAATASSSPAASAPPAATAPPATAPPTAPPVPSTCGAPANPYGYNFCGGSTISSPPGDFCSYFNCISTFANGRGYVVQCQDGTFSKSGGISGSCSRHGGDSRPLYQ